jgi:hypothetical protein
MNDRSGESGLEVVSAEVIARKLRREPWVATKLHKKKIRGKLDLSHLVIEAPLEIQDCCFEGEVDLTYCEFQQVVNFSGCTFSEKFNSGDATHSLTIYRKNLICNGCRFENEAYFNGMRVEGDAHFVGSCFELEELEKLPDSQLGSRYTVDFTDAQFGYQLICNGATFKGPVTFKAVECGGYGSFDGCRFITKTTIKDEAEINFNWASFGRNLWCRGAEFSAKVNFRSVKCGYNAFLKNTRFDGEVDLRFLDVGRDLDLRWTFWARRAKLAQIQVSKKLLLGGACFRGPVELYDSNIGVLELWDPNHPNDEAIEVRTRKGDLEVVVHKDRVNVELRRWEDDEKKAERRIRRFLLSSKDGRDHDEGEDLVEKLFPFKFGHEQYLTGLNLTGTSFERFHGGPSEKLAKTLALKLADEQDPTRFSIDPYRNLRSHYANIGDEAEARNMRVSGYHGLRENVRRTDGRSNWTPKRRMAEWLLYRPTRYGYRIWPILLPAIGVLFLLGTVVFWSHGSLEPVAGTEYEPPYDAPLTQKMFERSIYSLDLLVPALNLRYEAMWVPATGWVLGWLYATVHSILGWILIALLVTWLTGVIKPPD